MKILKKYYTVLNYSISPEAFNKQNKVFRTWGTSSPWKFVERDIYKLIYEIDFIPKDENTDEYLIKYFGRLELDCTFDDIEKDASEVIALKEQAHSSMSIFLEQNTMSFFKYIDFPQENFFINENIADDPIAQREFLMNIEIKNIKWAMNILTFEEMSEEEREIKRNQC